MDDIGIKEALRSGFGLIRRRPVAFLAWVLLHALLGVAPTVLILALLGPGYVEMIQAMATSGGQPDMGLMQTAAYRAQGAQGLSLLASLVLHALLYAAIFRAIMQPQKAPYAYLRLGGDELRLGLLIAIFYVGFTALAVVGLLIVAVPVALVAASSGVAGAVAGVIGCVALIGLFVWLAARLSMVLPMTFAMRRIEIGEAWALTKGRVRALCALVLLLAVVVLVMGVVAAAAVAAALGAFAGLTWDPGAWRTYLERPPEALLGDLWPLAMGWSLVSAVIGTLFSVVLTAPWATVYQRLVADPTDATEG